MARFEVFRGVVYRIAFTALVLLWITVLSLMIGLSLDSYSASGSIQ